METKYGKPNKYGMVSIEPDVMKGIKKGDKMFIWLKGDVREIEILNTYDHKNGICIDYRTKTTCGTDWVDISELFKDRTECIKSHLRKVNEKNKKQLQNINSKFALNRNGEEK